MNVESPPTGLAVGLARDLVALRQVPFSQEVRRAARERLFHSMGVSASNGRIPAAEVAWAALNRQPGPSFVYGRDTRLTAEDAAFVNGALGHGSLIEDCGPGGLREGSHPGTYVIPAALAMAEERGATGEELLAALVIGYEVVGRIGVSGPAEVVKRRFRPLGVMGAFGAAAAAATLMRADEAQMASALAFAANLAGGSTQGIFEGTMEPYFQAAFGSRNGILAARLGCAGAITSTEALEGEFGFFQTYGGTDGDAEALRARPDKLAIQRVGTKQFAACLQNQETLAVILEGLDAPLTEDEIARVTISRPALGTNGLNSPGVSRRKPFPNMLSAQMSARFTAAAALLGQPVQSPMFYAEHHADPVYERLTDRIELDPTEGGSPRVTVELTDGTVRIFETDQSQLLFPAHETFRPAFLGRATPVLGVAAEAAADAIEHFDQLAKVSELTQHLSPAQ